MSEGLNRVCLGRRYQGDSVVAEAGVMRAFAQAVGDLNPSYVGDDPVAHPLFAVRLLRGLMPQLLGDPELGCDQSRLVHGEQRFTYEQPVRAGDSVALEGVVSAIEDKRSGQVLRVEQRLLVDGRLAVLGEAAAFIKAPSVSSPIRTSSSMPEPEFAASSSPALHTATHDVDAAAAVRYAEATGDFNPIHLDPEAARKAGLPAVILHGTCTLALAARAIVDGVLEGDPTRLKSLDVRFAKPVFLPDCVVTEVRRADSSLLHFETRNAEGEVVLTRGMARC